MRKKTYDKPSTVTASDGQVLMDGPDGVDVALTPDAAFETADRLTDSAIAASGEERLRQAGEEKRPPQEV